MWAAINLLLEGLVFAYIGLQLKSVVAELLGSGRPMDGLRLGALLILLSAMAFLVLWMFASNYLPGVSHLIGAGAGGGARRCCPGRRRAGGPLRRSAPTPRPGLSPN